jgi:hypothetical protein
MASFCYFQLEVFLFSTYYYYYSEHTHTHTFILSLGLLEVAARQVIIEREEKERQFTFLDERHWILDGTEDGKGVECLAAFGLGLVGITSRAFFSFSFLYFLLFLYFLFFWTVNIWSLPGIYTGFEKHA